MNRALQSLIALIGITLYSTIAFAQSDDAPAKLTWKSLVAQIDAPSVQRSLQSQKAGRAEAITEIRRRILANQLTDDQWKELLTPERLFKWRKTWAKGEPFIVELVCPDWLGQPFEIRATPRLAGAKTLRAGRTWAGLCGLGNLDLREREPKYDCIERCGVVGLLADSDSSVEFDVEIRTGADPGMIHSGKYWDASRVVRKARISIDVRQVDDAAEVCRPVRSTEKNVNIERVVRPIVHYHDWADGSTHAYIELKLYRSAKRCSNVGLGFIVELLKDGRAVESIDFPAWVFWEHAADCYSARGDYMFDALRNQDKELKNPEYMKRWSIRIKGVNRMAWPDWTYDKYWDGEFTTPLSGVYRKK